MHSFNKMETNDLIKIVICYFFTFLLVVYAFKLKKKTKSYELLTKSNELLIKTSEIVKQYKIINQRGDYYIKIYNDEHTELIYIYILLSALFNLEPKEITEKINKIEKNGFELFGDFSKKVAGQYSEIINGFVKTNSCDYFKYEVIKKDFLAIPPSNSI